MDRDSDVYRLADFMHSNYEYFAWKNDWRTQKRTRVAFDDLPETNRQTMLDLAEHLIKVFHIHFDDICVPDPNLPFPERLMIQVRKALLVQGNGSTGDRPKRPTDRGARATFMVDRD